MENKILELEKKLKDMELKYNHLFEIVEELNYYFLKEMSEPYYGGDYHPIFIPGDNSKYLESGLGYYDESEYISIPKLTEDSVKKYLQRFSPSDLTKRIKEKFVGCIAPKYLWSIYGKVYKLKEQEKNKIKKEYEKKFTEIVDKIQSKKEDIEKRKEELKEKIKEKEVETDYMKKELDKYEEED